MQGAIHPTQLIRSPQTRRLAVAACVSGVLLAGCGGSSTRSSGGSVRETSASAPIAELAFSKCMRANGVPNFPDLTGHGLRIVGNGQTLSVNGVSVNAPAFRAAHQTCEKYMPHTEATPEQSAQQRHRGLQFARCMRSHGVPNFPDPRVISSSGGNQEVYLPGVNPQSPAFVAGAKACGGGPKGP